MPGFNKLVCFQQFDKCKFQKFSRGACPQSPLDEACAFGACSPKKLALWKNTNLRALE